MPLRFPIADKYKDMGTCVMGKLEAGTIKKGESLVLLPNKINVTVEEIFIDQGEGTVSLGEAAPGDNIKMKIKGVEEVCPVEVCQLYVFSPHACCCRRVAECVEYVAECHILLPRAARAGSNSVGVCLVPQGKHVPTLQVV
jgi:GTPase